ncbi:topoisomerase C-terminal repeat-containing protein, partial [Cohnella zeiphila]
LPRRAGRGRGAASGGSAGAGEAARATRETAAAAAPAVVGTCPRPGCGGQIFMGRKGYGCSHYKSGCSFVIWKESLGRTLSDAMVRSLIEKGRTSKLKFKSASGESYDARLRLANPATGELALERE